MEMREARQEIRSIHSQAKSILQKMDPEVAKTKDNHYIKLLKVIKQDLTQQKKATRKLRSGLQIWKCLHVTIESLLINSISFLSRKF